MASDVFFEISEEEIKFYRQKLFEMFNKELKTKEN